ncbi:hypothetical protein ACFL0P_00580 [Candidatus Omnitrophota bacterium]
MLKRYQVLLNDWMVQRLKEASERYDISQSEVIRILLCLQAIRLVSQLYPKQYKDPGLEKVVLNTATKVNKKQAISLEGFHRLISKIYYEAQKATEVREKQESKIKNNRSIILR